MPQYYVEGLFANKQGVKKSAQDRCCTLQAPSNHMPRRSGRIALKKPFKSPRLSWRAVNGPKDRTSARVTEEQRMRSIGAPEFPGLSTRPQKTKKIS